MTAPDFIEIAPDKDIEVLINKFENDTDSKIYPGQDTRILIQLIVYYANLIKVQFNEAAKLNLVQFSKYPILDFLGAMKGCYRLENELDDDYIERILLAPEGFSVAGPELAYIYHIKSADSSIKDVKLDVPSDDITIDINGESAVLIEDNFSGTLYNANCNYIEGEVNITLNEGLSANSTINVKVPHPYKIFAYILTENGEADDELITKVENALSKVKPLCDFPVIKSAKTVTFEISGKIFLRKDADETTVKESVKEVLNNYLKTVNDCLKKSIVLNHIKGYLISIDGIYDVELTTPEALEAKVDTAYKGTIGEFIYERLQNE